MSAAKGRVGFGGHLDVQHFKGPQGPRPVKSMRVPGGRLMFTRDKGESTLLAGQQLVSNLSMVHKGGDGRVKDVADLGSGLVTNAGVNLMSYDMYWVPTYTKSALQAANYHAIGTGSYRCRADGRVVADRERHVEHFGFHERVHDRDAEHHREPDLRERVADLSDGRDVHVHRLRVGYGVDSRDRKRGADHRVGDELEHRLERHGYDQHAVRSVERSGDVDR